MTKYQQIALAKLLHNLASNDSQCPNETMIISRILAMTKFLAKLVTTNTTIHIITTFELKLSCLLMIPYHMMYTPSSTMHQHQSSTLSTLYMALRHQNLIGWHLLLRRFVSVYRMKAFQALMLEGDIKHQRQQKQWDYHVLRLSIEMYKSICDARNIFLHGTSSIDAQRLF